MGVMRKWRAGERRPAAAPDGSDRFPHLVAFLSGYLHQDFALDHRTPAAALAAFLADARADERVALRDEWRRFRAGTDGLQWREIRDRFAALGGAWRPPSRVTLFGLFAALEDVTDR